MKLCKQSGVQVYFNSAHPERRHTYKFSSKIPLFPDHFEIWFNDYGSVWFTLTPHLTNQYPRFQPYQNLGIVKL